MKLPKTVRDLIKAYKSDPQSPYVKPPELGGITGKTAQNYKSLLRRIRKDHGDKRLADLKRRHMDEWHAAWLPRGVHTAHALMGMVRGLFSFGMGQLDCPQCERMRNGLNTKRFKTGAARTQRMTAEQITAIRNTARCMNRPSIALEQSFQFEGTYRQGDVIGRYLRNVEPTEDDIGARRYGVWDDGLRWEHIDDALVLRKVTNKKGKPHTVDLKLAPMVLVELQSAYCELGEELTRDKLPKSGPIIINEDTGLPYTPHQFRKLWREIADACGIPKDVRNMDTRASAITEAAEAGVDKADIQQAATHSQPSTTDIYIRGRAAEKATARTAVARVAARNAKE